MKSTRFAPRSSAVITFALAGTASFAGLVGLASSSGCGASNGRGSPGGTGADTSDGSTSTASGRSTSTGLGGASTGSAATGGASTGTSSSGVNFTTGSSSGTPCTGLQCQIHGCTTSGTTTTISGTIYDPAGKNPLYGVVAYVPNSTPAAITSGAQCTSCSDLYTGDPIAAAVSDASGKFTITNVPDGANIPLVIQVGKWRRQFVIPQVTTCVDTAVPDKTLLLPKNGTEGDIPNIAISTGSADTLECLLVRIGVDPAEYVPDESATGHIHIFGGGGPNTSPPGKAPQTALWDSAADIMKYDIVLLSCEGEETKNMNQPVMFDYASAGGRVFGSHFHYAWFNTGPFGAQNLATWTPGSNQTGNSLSASVVTTDWTGQPFARGQAMHDWLQNVNALTNNLLTIDAPRHNADVAATNTPSQPWIVVSNATSQAQDFTFDTPVGADAGAQCGRVAFSDMHVGAASKDYSGGTQTTPGGCSTGDLSPQEKALEFIFFDLASCVTPDNMVQPPPPTMTQ